MRCKAHRKNDCRHKRWLDPCFDHLLEQLSFRISQFKSCGEYILDSSYYIFTNAFTSAREEKHNVRVTIFSAFTQYEVLSCDDLSPFTTNEITIRTITSMYFRAVDPNLRSICAGLYEILCSNLQKNLCSSSHRTWHCCQENCASMSKERLCLGLLRKRPKRISHTCFEVI